MKNLSSLKKYRDLKKQIFKFKLKNTKSSASQSNLLSFSLGTFTFLTELVILRQLSVFLGSGITATGLVIFLFISGMGIGNLFSIKKYHKDLIILLTCSVGLMILALSPQIISLIPSNKVIFVYILALLTVIPGLVEGYFYAETIKKLVKNHIIIFILSNILGSLFGCLFSFLLLRILGVKETLALLSFSLLPFLIKDKKLLYEGLLINIVLFVLLLNSQPKIVPQVYREIIKESQKIDFPVDINETPLSKNIIFKKPSLFGDVIVDSSRYLYVHNEGMCGTRSTEERIMSQKVNALNPNAKNILVIGLGCGMTLDEYLEQNTNQEAKIKVVEINPVVVEAERLFFEKNNPVDDPRVELFVEDGFKYLLNSNERFDVIIIDISNPLAIESSSLYTKEFVELLYSHLDDQGHVAWWNFRTDSDYDRICYNTIRSIFQYVNIKKMGYSLIFYAGKSPFFIELNTEEASTMNQYEKLPFDVNSIDKPLFK